MYFGPEQEIWISMDCPDLFLISKATYLTYFEMCLFMRGEYE